jgi:hypothetical protein
MFETTNQSIIHLYMRPLKKKSKAMVNSKKISNIETMKHDETKAEQ